jgi:hypothetical protein
VREWAGFTENGKQRDDQEHFAAVAGSKVSSGDSWTSIQSDKTCFYIHNSRLEVTDSANSALIKKYETAYGAVQPQSSPVAATPRGKVRK